MGSGQWIVYGRQWTGVDLKELLYARTTNTNIKNANASTDRKIGEIGERKGSYIWR